MMGMAAVLANSLRVWKLYFSDHAAVKLRALTSIGRREASAQTVPEAHMLRHQLNGAILNFGL